MQSYAIGNLPFIRKLKQPSKWIQNWYADDGSCLGPFHSLVEWLKIVQDEEPKHGYFNETSKNIVIVAPQFKEQAQALFQEFGIQVLTGHRFLGSFVGSELDQNEWLKGKTDFWAKSIKKLAEIAKSDPHSAFVAVSKSLQNEWSFIQRVLPTDEH